jgi:hypothetical protein
MKYLLLGLLLSMATCSVSAQETETEKKSVSRDLDEVYQVYLLHRKIKDGPYEVVDDHKNVLVKGAYKEGKKYGVWTYLNSRKETVQQYDFTNNKMVYNANDSATIVHTQYEILGGVDPRDTVVPPVKIGGVNYGFLLIYDDRDIPQEVKSASADELMTYVLTISEKGELLGWKVMFGGKIVNDISLKKSVKGLPADAYEFIPATVNGQPVKSQMSYWVALNVNHVDQQGTNNIVTQHP